MVRVNSLHILIILCGALTSSAVIDEVNQSFSILDRKATILGEDQKVTCSENYSCVNCTAVRVCGPTPDRQGLEEIKRFTCPPTAAWCDSLSATCVAEQPLECLVPVPADQFHCMRDGNYPHLSDCSSYYRCISGTAYLHRCVAPRRFYHPTYEQCSNSNSCANPRICDGKNGLKIKVVSDNKQLFAYCANSTVTALDRCIGAYTFNVTSQNCEKSCPNGGLFPSIDGCNKYYKCMPVSKLSTTFNITEMTCPVGEGFLETAYECVNRTLVLNCNLTLPDLYSRK